MASAGQSRFDAIVVGTGPGGATVARELTRAGRKVLILEWGPAKPVRGNFRQYLSEQLVPGKSLLLTNGLLGMVRGITVGGSSMFYYATAFPVPFEMLRARGVDIAGDVEHIRRELRVAPLRDDMMTPMARRILEAARQVGLGWKKLDKFIDQERWRPEYRFGYYGDPHGVKWSAKMFVDEAVAGGATLVDRAKVERVLVEGDSATGVEYRKRGRLQRASADAVVVAAGGIGSPVILRASGIPEAGFDYFFDPLISVAGTVKDVRLQHNEIPMSAGVLMDEGYMMTDMALPPAVHMAFTAEVGRLTRLLAFRSTARIMVKARDTLGGRITAGGGVRKKLQPADRDKLMHGFENAKRVLRAAGAKNVYKTWYFAAHPGGTVKLGELVDARLQTRFRNLYVCDCSVIPEAWGLPPTLTLLGLGRRLGRQLAGERVKRQAALA
jgi:choline dehydrogenase-like flavoprotein